MSGCLSLERVSSFVSQDPLCEIQRMPFTTLLQNHKSKTYAPYSGCVAICSKKGEPRFFDSETLLSYLKQEKCFSYPKDAERPFREIHFFSTRDVKLLDVMSVGVSRDTISAETQHVIMAHSTIKLDVVRNARQVLYSVFMAKAGNLYSQGNLEGEHAFQALAVFWLQSIVHDFPDDIESSMILAEHRTQGIGCPKDANAALALVEKSEFLEMKRLGMQCLKFSFATTCCFFLPSQTMKIVQVGLFALKLIPQTKNLCRGPIAQHFKIGAIASLVLKALSRPFLSDLALLPSFCAKVFACISPADLLCIGLGPLAAGINCLKGRLFSSQKT
jgi:hypothetical protein